MNKDLSGLLGYILLLGGVAVVAMAIMGKKEQFVPEFLDQGNVKQTAKTGTSSYAQETNHFKLTPPVPEPISGSQTPFRVNMFTAYME